MISDESIAVIEQLYYSMYDTLFFYAQLHSKDLAPPEDIVHDTFRIACVKSEELINSENPKGWLMLTMKNVIRNLKQKQAHYQSSILTLTAQTECELAAKEDPIDIHLLYGKLAETEDFKMVWEQANGRAIQEIANERSISVNTCKKRLQRAKEALRKKICNF